MLKLYDNLIQYDVINLEGDSLFLVESDPLIQIERLNYSKRIKEFEEYIPKEIQRQDLQVKQSNFEQNLKFVFDQYFQKKDRLKSIIIKQQFKHKSSNHTEMASDNILNGWVNHRFQEPSKKLKTQEDVEIFKKTGTFQEYIIFVCEMQVAVKSKMISETKNNGKFQKIIKYLDQLDQLLEKNPPIQQPMRFGNQAFKNWHAAMVKTTENFLKDLLPEQIKDASIELQAYLQDSFGSNVRLDYGTGHEMAFVFFLLALKKLNFYDSTDLEVLCRFVFYKYINLMRKIQVTYMLEPAGSHGVWGLDDYHFLPFLFGANELVNSSTVVDPSYVHKDDILKRYEKEYMYLHCIDFIKQQKKGPFYEHSPILNDISGAQNWTKVAQGMVKMYQAEVLYKFPVVKHIYFGTILPFA